MTSLQLRAPCPSATRERKEAEVLIRYPEVTPLPDAALSAEKQSMVYGALPLPQSPELPGHPHGR